MKRVRFLALLLVAVMFCSTAIAANINVTYNINTDVNRTPISKYIYGTNSTGDANYTIVRSGGNRLTGYNWENNYSNAGNDWLHYNDQFMVGEIQPSSNPDRLIPGIAITRLFHDKNVANKQDSIVTLQMAGYVSADGLGTTVTWAQRAPSTRWKSVVYAKGAPFCSPAGSPVTTDANVYMDEFVNFLVQKYGYAGDTNGVKFYCLDNEPDIWSAGDDVNGTHPRLHTAKASCKELMERSVALSLAVKNVDPNAQILGPVSYGFNGYNTFQDANDWSSLKNGYGWFLDYYLDKMEANSVAAGKRLLDVLDLHWYPEARDGTGDKDGNRIVDTPSVYSRANCTARMQAPRSLWDYDYHEVSWIEHWNPQWLPILPPIKNSITNYYPGTKLSFTEYAYGAQNHYSGGIATADALGIFGKYGVYIANYWFDNVDNNYVDAAIKTYTNYDGAESKFGDTEVYATDSNKVDSSIYASVFDGYTCELHLIVINKNIDNAITGTFNITSPQHFRSGNVWKFDSNDPNITATTGVYFITNNSFSYTIPKLTVCHMVLQADPPSWDTTGPEGVPDGYVDIFDLDDFCNHWLHNYMFGHFASFAQQWGM